MNNVKILVAEDEIGTLVNIRDYLSDQGFIIECAKDVEELIANVQTADILIVDVRLPMKFGERVDPNGIKTVAKLLEENILKPNVPLIFISIYAESEDVCQKELRDVRIPTDRYCWLQKPFEMELLEDKINNQQEYLKS